MGPGTELKAILSDWFRLTPGGCDCDEHAAQMDKWGPDECEDRIDEISDWLLKEANNRGWVMKTMASSALTKRIIKMAIKRSRSRLNQRPGS